MFLPQDVADETAVVDSLGQRLTLNIENIRGGGGQRRISVYCPFWIVNTTEHALRYKQEGSKSYVSGTVLNPEANGSLPLSGNRANDGKGQAVPARIKTVQGDGTIFSGTPGALATSSGRCDFPPNEVARLVDKNLPLESLAKLAFMFNFHEGLVSVGHQRMSVQLADGMKDKYYSSDWSRGISLESVGFSQMLG